MSRSRRTTLIPLLVVVMYAGCYAGDGRQPVEGTVTLDDVPMAEAAISFRPAQGTQGPSSGGTILQGKFRVPAEKGLMPGTYQVSIVCMRETGRIINDPQKGQVPELVQVRFDSPPPVVSVAADQVNQFEFQLRSSSSRSRGPR